MGSLKKDMKKLFETDNLYQLLNVEKTASPDEIKRAYRKLSLKVHPDRAQPDDKASATAKFQVLAKVHSVLADKKKRKIYDETGVADDDLISDKVSDWTQYFQTLFKKVDLADIDALEKEYVGSDEEKNDVKSYYVRFKGDMNKMMEFLMFYQFDREDTYRDMIKTFIKSKEVPDFKCFTQEDPKSIASRRKKCEAEAKAAAKAATKRKKAGEGSGDADLVKMIRERQETAMGSLIGNLEEKYGGKGKKKPEVKKSGKDEPGSDQDSSDEGEWEGMDGDEVDKSDEEDDGEESEDSPDERPPVKETAGRVAVKAARIKPPAKRPRK